MDTNTHEIPFVAYESVCTRLERTNKRLFVLCVILILVLLATNTAWIAYEIGFEDVAISQTVKQDTNDGENKFIGGDYYSSTTSSSNKD